MEQGVAYQVETLGDGVKVLPDLLAEGIPARRDVAEFLQHRKVLVGLDIAHHTGVAIPVPGASHATCRIDDADALDPRLAEVRPCQNARDATADDHDVGVVGDGLAVGVRRKGSAR